MGLLIQHSCFENRRVAVNLPEAPANESGRLRHLSGALRLILVLALALAVVIFGKCCFG